MARLYGELRSLIRRLPQEQQQEKFDAARRLMSEHYREMDRAKRSDVLKKLVSQASFLRMVVPRRPGDGSITGARFVFRDGGIVEDSSISDGIRCVEDGGLLKGVKRVNYLPYSSTGDETSYQSFSS